MRPFIGYAMKDMSDYNKTVSSKIGRQQGNDICFISFRYTYMRRRAKHDSEPTYNEAKYRA